MSTRRQSGTTLVVGLILLSLVTLLGLAGASTAHVERLLAQNGLFRENAASAASAGIESAIRDLVNTIDPTTFASATSSGFMPGSTDRYETVTRFEGWDSAVPQSGGARLAGAHFEITSTGFASRRAIDRQRANVMLVLERPAGVLECEPIVPVHCFERGELVRMSWQHLAAE